MTTSVGNICLFFQILTVISLLTKQTVQENLVIRKSAMIKRNDNFV